MDVAKGKSKGDASAHRKGRDRDERKDPSSSEKEPDYIYSTTSNQADRTLFVVDLSRLKAERDTLENALVLYRPEAEFKKPQYEQRCSQLVGMALCTMNFSGKYPEFVRLRGTCYAIRALGETYVMGLSSRVDEPPLCTVNYLNTLHDTFLFYFKSADNVLRKCMDDWEIFTNSMSSIFNNLLCYLTRDQHSVPSMLSPIPYATVNREKIRQPQDKRSRSRVYMLASRVLKACQGHQTILGGCILHNATILTSQFPSALTEKIAVVGGGAISLDQHSILEDNIAPGKVWVIEVFLYDEDMREARVSRKNHAKIDNVYSSLCANPNPTHYPPLNLNLSPPTAPKRMYGQWRNRRTSSQTSPPPLPNRSISLRPNSTSDMPPPLPTRDPPTFRPTSTSSVASSSGQPLASSTPYHRSRGSISSEDAVQLSPGLTRVQFHQPSSKKPSLDPIMAVGKKLERAAAAKKDDDYEDLDNWDGVDPSMSLPARVISKSQPITTNSNGSSGVTNGAAPTKMTPNEGSPVVGGLTSRPSTGSISSEGFTTPPPSLPPKSHMELIGNESSSDHTHHRNQGESLLSRHIREMTDDEIEKLVNTPVTLPCNDQPPIAMVTTARPQKVPALPSDMRTWKSKVVAEPESDDDNDFVDSTELQEMLLANHLEKQTSITTASASEAMKLDDGMRSPSPPPLPPREYTLPREPTSSTTQEETDEEETIDGEVKKLPVATVVGQLSKQTVVPPLHIRHVTGMGVGLLYSEQEIDGERGGGGGGKDGTLKREDEMSSASWLYSDDLDATEEEQSGNVENCFESMDDDASNLYSTVQRTQLKGIAMTTAGSSGGGSKTRHDYDTISVPLGGGGNPVINGSKDNDYDDIISIDQVKLQMLPEKTTAPGKPTNPGAEYDHLQGVAPSSRVDNNIRMTSNSSASLSLPLTVDEQDGRFQSSIISDDVFSNSTVTPVTPVEDPSSKQGLRRELGASDVQSLRPDDVDVSVQSEQNSQLKSDSSSTTEMELSSVSESLMRDGFVTPAQRTLNESVVNMIRYGMSQTPERASGSGMTGEEEEENELLDSAEYSSLPEDDGVMEDEGEEGAGSKSSTRTDMTNVTYEELGRPRSKSWLTKTMELRKTSTPSVKMDKKCLYIQQYLSTMVVLLADSGLHMEHGTLNQLWRSLLPQLLELDNSLKGEEAPSSSTKPPDYVVTYSKLDRYCEANPKTASFHYRHALRRLHQEYGRDPTLLQASLCKDTYARLLSQRIHDREVYFQPSKPIGGTHDSLAVSDTLEWYAKSNSVFCKEPSQQQMPLKPKPMLIL